MLHNYSINHNLLFCMTNYCLTKTQASKVVKHPVKQKQALLESNLPGLTGAKKSQRVGTRSSYCAPTHHFGLYLKKLKKVSAILGLDRLVASVWRMVLTV